MIRLKPTPSRLWLSMRMKSHNLLRFAISRRMWSLATSVAAAALVLGSVQLAHGTTIAVKLGNQQVILAGNSREDRLNMNSGTLRHTPYDVACKLVALGSTGVGASENLDCKRNDPSEAITDWSAIADARTTYELRADEVHTMAIKWAQRAEQ